MSRRGKGRRTETAECPGISHLPAALVIVLSHRRWGKTPASPDHDPLERVLQCGQRCAELTKASSDLFGPKKDAKPRLLEQVKSQDSAT